MESSEPERTEIEPHAEPPDLAALLTGLPLVMYRCQPEVDGRMLYVSAGCRALTGHQAAAFTSGEVLYADLIWAEDRAAVAAELQAARSRGRVYHCQYRLAAMSDSTGWVVDVGRFTGSGSALAREGCVLACAQSAQAEPALVLEERSRLARELHDSVTQSLYSVTLFAEAGRHLAETGAAERAGQYFEDVLSTSQQALRELRLLVHKLRPSILAKAGLARALQQRLNGVEGRTGIQHTLQVGSNLQLTPDQEEALYHIAQEALNNALKHAAATSVKVIITQTDGFIQMTVADNGRGFDLAGAHEGGGLGLETMQERATGAGGQVTFTTALDAGTIVTVILAVAATAGQDGGGRNE